MCRSLATPGLNYCAFCALNFCAPQLERTEGRRRLEQEAILASPMSEHKVFRELMHRIEESTCDTVGTFRRPGDCTPHRYALLRKGGQFRAVACRLRNSKYIT